MIGGFLGELLADYQGTDFSLWIVGGLILGLALWWGIAWWIAEEKPPGERA